MTSELPARFIPYADEYERIQRILLYLDLEAGRSAVTYREASDIFDEADLVSHAYIEYTKKQSGFHDLYWTNMANYIIELAENLKKRRDEDPVETPPLSYTFKYKDDRGARGPTMGVMLMHTIEDIYNRIKDLELEEFLSANTKLLARKKEALVDRLKEMFDQAYADDITDLEELLKVAKSASEEKRAASLSIPLEPDLDMLAWYSHRVEMVMDEVHDMMDRHKEDKKTELWRTSVLERSQLAASYCEELKEEVNKYFADNPETQLQRDALALLPEINPKDLIGRSYENLSVRYRNALKEFTGRVKFAIQAIEKRKIGAEIDSIFAQNLLSLRERQIAAAQGQTPARPSEHVDSSSSAPGLLDDIQSISLDDYARCVAELRIKEIQRISLLSFAWNQQLNWHRGYPRRDVPECRLDMGMFDEATQAQFTKWIGEGRDRTRAPEPLGWWNSAE